MSNSVMIVDIYVKKTIVLTTV